MLYLVATPIGNLEDITLRALNILKSVDIIACEDTRNTQKLLNHYEINNKKLVSYHEHNEEVVSEKILNHLNDGKNVALVTDAGMPCISDPGYILVKKARENNVKITALPGANAGLTALVASGIESYNYSFYGFLPRKNNELKEKLNEILASKTTSIIYESPHRVLKLIETINLLDNEREISVARELTKMFEQVVTDSTEKVLEMFSSDEIKIKGEFVIVIAPNKNEAKNNINLNILVDEIDEKVRSGVKKSEAIKEITKKYNVNKKEVYNLYHEKYD